MSTAITRRLARAVAAVAALSGATLVAPTPAHAAWGDQYPFSIQVTYHYPTGTTSQIGRAVGWVQLDDGGDSFRYSVTVCRQSGYTPPELSIGVNAHWVGQTYTYTGLEYIPFPAGTNTAPTAPCYGDTQTVTGTETYPGFSNVYFKLSGDTMVGYTHVTLSEDRTLTPPF